VALYTRLASAFGLGYFTAFGVLAMANVTEGWPHTFARAGAYALSGGVAAVAASLFASHGQLGR
jgi:hypothetical protein